MWNALLRRARDAACPVVGCGRSDDEATARTVTDTFLAAVGIGCSRSQRQSGPESLGGEADDGRVVGELPARVQDGSVDFADRVGR